MKSKLLMLLAVLVVLFAAVSLSGCLGGDNNTTTNNTTNNTTPPVNNTTPPAANNTTNNTTPPANNTTNNTTPPANAVTVVMGEGGPEPTAFMRVINQHFTTSSLTLSTGDTLRIMNTESRQWRHLYQSEEGVFEEFNLNPRYSATLTFNAPGTYRINLLNYYTGEPFSNSGNVLTVTVN